MSDVIPEGWSEDSIGRYIADSSAGEWGEEANGGENDIPVLRATNFSKSGAIDYRKLAVRSIEEKKRVKKSLKRGDIVLEKSGGSPTQPVGRVIFFENDKPFLYSNFTQKLSPITDCDSKYLFYKLYYEYHKGTVFQFQQQTTGIINFQLAEYLRYRTIFAPLPEQKKIAAILSSVDEVIEKTQAQIEKLKDLKIGMMQELLSPREPKAGDQTAAQASKTNGLHHTEFKDSPLGRIPVGWEVVKFKDIFVDYKYGPRFSSKDYSLEGNVKTIRGTDVANNGEVRYGQVPTAQIDPDTVEAHKLKDGDLVMITTADCGASAVFQEQSIPYIASAYAIKLTPTEKVIPAYIKFFMQTSNAMNQIESYIRKGTVANLPGSDVMNIALSLPPLEIQQKIAEILNTLEVKIDLTTKKSDQLRSTKKALMQDLLTGKVRVQVDAA